MQHRHLLSLVAAWSSEIGELIESAENYALATCKGRGSELTILEQLQKAGDAEGDGYQG